MFQLGICEFLFFKEFKKVSVFIVPPVLESISEQQWWEAAELQGAHRGWPVWFSGLKRRQLS